MKRWQDITVMNACDCCFYQRKMPWRFLVYSCSHSCDQRDCCHVFWAHVGVCVWLLLLSTQRRLRKQSINATLDDMLAMYGWHLQHDFIFVFFGARWWYNFFLLRTLMTEVTHYSSRFVYLQSRIVRVAQKQMIKYGCMKRWQKHNNNVCVWLLLVLTQRCHDVP